MQIQPSSFTSPAAYYARQRDAQEAAAQAKARMESAAGAAQSHVGSQVSLQVSSVTEGAQQVSGMVVQVTPGTPVSPASVAVLDASSGKLVYQSPPRLGLA